MIFSTSVGYYRYIECAHEITRVTSTAFLYYIGLLVIGLAIIVPLFEREFEPVGWQRMLPVAIELPALIGSALLWSVASSRVRENVKTCSECGGKIEVVSGGFDHGLVPNLDDFAIGLLFAGVQVGIVFAFLGMGTAS